MCQGGVILTNDSVPILKLTMTITHSPIFVYMYLLIVVCDVYHYLATSNKAYENA